MRVLCASIFLCNIESGKKQTKSQCVVSTKRKKLQYIDFLLKIVYTVIYFYIFPRLPAFMLNVVVSQKSDIWFGNQYMQYEFHNCATYNVFKMIRYIQREILFIFLDQRIMIICAIKFCRRNQFSSLIIVLCWIFFKVNITHKFQIDMIKI